MASLCLREADKIGDMEKGEILVHLSRIVVGGWSSAKMDKDLPSASILRSRSHACLGLSNGFRHHKS